LGGTGELFDSEKEQKKKAKGAGHPGWKGSSRGMQSRKSGKITWGGTDRRRERDASVKKKLNVPQGES